MNWAWDLAMDFCLSFALLINPFCLFLLLFLFLRVLYLTEDSFTDILPQSCGILKKEQSYLLNEVGFFCLYISLKAQM